MSTTTWQAPCSEASRMAELLRAVGVRSAAWRTMVSQKMLAVSARVMGVAFWSVVRAALFRLW